MDKSAIKNFAIGARVKLKEQIEQKAYTFGITKDEIKQIEMFEDTFEVNGNKYNKKSLKHRESLVKKINEKGFIQVIEEVAYIWFNRLIAIRFMEVNEYLPSGIRVLSSTHSSKVEPDIIREAANLEFENLNIDLIYKLQDENNTEELFKYLLIRQCNELGKIMPVVFEEIEDYTELLLPDKLLQEGSIIRDLVTSIAEEDWKEQVEIIGWLYQYYISEKKDEVFAALKNNVKITKENIPAATQLFTPDWIVKYMVENSLGSMWLESHPNDELKNKWKYYLEEAEQESDVMKQLKVTREKNKELKPEDIKFLDPAMGSGHILVYAFDVFYDIYKSAGYPEREIIKFILEKNLYGLDIDDRAAQLSYFAVMMKARSYNRRIFRERIDLNIYSIQESNNFPKEAIDFLIDSKETEIEKKIHREDVEYLINKFNDAKEFGSILEVKEIDFDTIRRRAEEIRNGDTADIFELQYKNIILEKIPALIKQAKILSQKYDVVVTNPPYMGNKGMNTKLNDYVCKLYPNTKSDLFAVFIEKGFSMTKESGYNAMVTMQSWMFLSVFEEMRLDIIRNKCITSLTHMSNMVMGIAFGTVATIFRNINLSEYKGVYTYVDYKDITIDNAPSEFPILNEKYNIAQLSDFIKLPSKTIAYWITENIIKTYKDGQMLGESASPKTGMTTADNNRFLRLWYEVDYNKVGLNFDNNIDAKESRLKWFPYSKGGGFRRWSGFDEYLINWENNGYEVKNNKNKEGKKLASVRSEDKYFLKCISWSAVTSYKFSCRMIENGHLFDSGGSSIFLNDNIEYISGLLNTKLAQMFMEISNNTINYQPGDVAKIPVIFTKNNLIRNGINNIVQRCIESSKNDWNYFEASWDFKIHPLFKHLELGSNKKLSFAFNIWKNEAEEAFQKLKSNEEELNRIFIGIYGLQEELTPDVEERDVTIRKADRVRDIKSFISYAIGCMLGRYSLDEEGLIYAGGEFKPEKYKIFNVDVDNVIPITNDEYFKADLVSRFVQFVEITFSEGTLEENLEYIADTLGKKGNETSRQTIRRYFLKDFYKDHLQIYKKKPIYWLFDSGKNDGFKALIYIHRYDIATVARVRTDYLHLLQRKYEAEVNRLDMVMENNNESVREKTEAKKKKEKIQKQILECVQYDQVIAHVANQKISINLDDGVSVNYGKFQGVELPQGEGKKPLKADLLAKI